MSDSAMISRYLLQDVAPHEREEIERRYFSDPEYLALVDAVEGDLIDAYVRKELSRAENERFEKYFLCTRSRRERLQMAEALIAHMPRRERSWRPALAIAAALIVILGIAAWMRTRTEPIAQTPRIEAPRAPVTIAVTLVPGLTRDAAEPRKIVLTPQVEQIRIQALVEVEGEWRDLRASLRSGNWTATGLTMSADRTVTIDIPASKLVSGEHVLVLSAGDEPLGDYPFIVQR